MEGLAEEALHSYTSASAIGKRKMGPGHLTNPSRVSIILICFGIMPFSCAPVFHDVGSNDGNLVWTRMRLIFRAIKAAAQWFRQKLNLDELEKLRWVKGWTQRKIAAHLSLPKTTATKTLMRLVLDAIADLGLSDTEILRRPRQIEKATRTVLKIDWKPFSMFSSEAARFR